MRFPIPPHPRLDSAATVFFENELRHILKEFFDPKYALLRGVQLVPVDASVPAVDETVEYRQFDSVGKAKLMVDMGDDLPQVNVMNDLGTVPLRNYGAAFGYSVDEIAAAASVGRPLDRMRAEAAKKTLDQKLDDIAAFGDSDAGLGGLLNISNTLTATAIDKAAGGKGWELATPDEILKDLNELARKAPRETKEVEKPTKILLPTAAHEIIETRARSTTSDTTILQFFQKNNPRVTVESWERLAEGNPDGLARAVAYDPQIMNLRLLMAIMFEQQAPQLKNYKYTVNCRMKTGGVLCTYPKSVTYMDLISGDQA